MSEAERLESDVPTTRGLKRKHLSDDERHDLDELDAIFERIMAKVPRIPYILSTPSLDPYRYHSQQEANAWTMGTLWGPDEEHKQYRTYLYREPTCQDCFELQAGEEEEPEPEKERVKASSNASSQPAKKKVNLSTFRVKPANGAAAPSTKSSSPNLAPTKHGTEKVNGVKSDKKPTSTVEGSKSPATHSSKQVQDHKAQVNDRDRPQPASRNRALSQNSDLGRPKANANPDTSNGTPHGLPRLLSPVHDPIPSNPYGLPNILSPTLPANVQAELDRLDAKRKRADSNTSTSSLDQKGQTLAVPPTAHKQPEDTRKAEGRACSISINGKSPTADHGDLTGAGAEEDSTLVVKLRIPKTKASTVKQILKLPPKRTNAEKKDRPDPVKDVSREEPPKAEGPVIKKKAIPKTTARRGDNTTPLPTPGAVPKSVPMSSKLSEKRPRTDDDAPTGVPSKRARALSIQDRPVTPAQPSAASSSPAPSVKSAVQKAQVQYTTPKKDLKAVNMLRTSSTESNDATPGRSGTTPAGIRLDSRGGPTSAPSGIRKTTDISLLAQTSMKLNQMGRTLKHEATKILTTAGSKLTKQDEKRAAVTNLECILSYMAAYYAQDYSLNLRGRAGEVEQTWKTLLPLCLSYARCTKDFQHLDGLRSYLSSVIASAICTHVSQRSATTSIRAHDSPQDLPHAELAKQHATIAENFALLADHMLKMHRHYQDARTALPMDELQSAYKKTYAAREKDPKLLRDCDKISGSRLAGAYFLPLSTDTSPIQAVRFGLRFLAEYVEKEGLEYVFRVDLGKAE